jgi:hypothetical protein
MPKDKRLAPEKPGEPFAFFGAVTTLVALTSSAIAR